MTYNLVHDIVPHIRHQLNLPLTLPAHHPLQVGVGRARIATNPAILHLREMALKKANLMLVGRTGHIRAAPLHTEVVVHGARVNRRFGLRNQLCAPHVAVPFGGAVDCDSGTLLGVGVAGVLV